MPTQKIRLYAADVTPLEDPLRFAAGSSVLSPARQARLNALRRPADQRRCAAAGLLLRHVLGTDAEPESGPYGKPFFPGGQEFSLSHSGNWVLCAAADRAVGCDVQRVGSFDLRVAKRYFSPAEYAVLLAQPDAEQAVCFYRYWTLKESFSKALGLGLHLPFSAFCINLTSPITVTQQVDPRTFGFAEFGEIPGYRCAVCAEAGCGDIRLEIIPLPLP